MAGAVALSIVLGFALWLWTPLVLLAHDDWRELVPGALIGAALGEERTLERAA